MPPQSFVPVLIALQLALSGGECIVKLQWVIRIEKGGYLSTTTSILFRSSLL
jgi:hypothetical protein